MIFYYSIFVILACLSLFEIIGLKKHQREIIFVGISLVLYIFSFIRWECGTDWYNYVNFYEFLPSITSTSDFEPLYFYFNHIAKFLFNSYTGVLFLCGTVVFLFQSSAILKQSIFPIFSLFMLFGISLGNIFFIRQTISTSILFYSIIYIQSGRFRPFLYCVIVASLFHYSSIIFIPAWFIYRLQFNNRKLLIVFLFSMMFSIIVPSILQLLGSVVGGIMKFKIDWYLSNTGEDSLQGTSYSLTFMLFKGLLNKAVILVPSIVFSKRICVKYPQFRGYLNLYWFGTILYFITAPISLVLVRFSFPYDITGIILVPLIIKFFSKNTRPFVFLIVSTYLILRMLVAINSYYDLYVPYRTIFS